MIAVRQILTSSLDPRRLIDAMNLAGLLTYDQHLIKSEMDEILIFSRRLRTFETL